MKIAHIYARYSTGTQAKGTSLRRQISNAEAFAAEQGWTIADIIADEGVSAYRGKNLAQGGLGRFFNAVKTGKVAPGSVLIVESLDRLSRNTVPAQMSLLLDIIRAGVEVVTLVDQKHFTCATVNANPLETHRLAGHHDSRPRRIQDEGEADCRSLVNETFKA